MAQHVKKGANQPQIRVIRYGVGEIYPLNKRL